MFLPDSNIIIRAFQGHRLESSVLQYYIENNTLVLSVIVIAEFLVKANADEKKRFDKLVKEFGTLIVDEDVARVASDYRKQFIRKTNKSFLSDCFIAAQVKVHHLTLVTNNKADFPMEDIKIISP